MYKMKKFDFLTVVFATLLIISSACSKKEVPGPAGQDALRKEGSVSGKIYKLNSAGTADTLLGTFAYEYFESQEDASYALNSEGKGISLVRRSAKESRDYFELFSNYITTLEEKPEETSLTINFSYNKALGNGKYLKFMTYDNRYYRTDIYFGSSNSTLSITNYSFNKSTGRLKFDYEMNIASYENSTYSPAKVIGSVNVTLLEEEYADNGPYMID
ncbi:hypothetical protein MYP_1714 [Sporocytophaga myxococcoides]|uniref:Lipoprotein n=2 Tax=Sporocytophaga myxococcoides TaxID=153721 RepID=A0A098LC19_9BACT|nr:hypothetical protein MYP_1714 [Sporocytophaga myxococcoides]